MSHPKATQSRRAILTKKRLSEIVTDAAALLSGSDQSQFTQKALNQFVNAMHTALIDTISGHIDTLEQSVEQTNSRYRVLYDNSPDMYASVDPKTRKLIECNKTLIKRLGFRTKQEVVGMELLNLYHPD